MAGATNARHGTVTTSEVFKAVVQSSSFGDLIGRVAGVLAA
jgi:hypothetical protein